MADTLCSSSDEEEILTYKLKIHDADITDSGKWKCEVQDKYGTVSATCDLNVFEEAKRMSLSNGSVVTKSGVSAGSSSDSEEEILTYRLKIHDTNITDAGSWRCEVKDKYGTASAACNLDVYNPAPPAEEPRFLMSLRDVTTLEGKSVKLICRIKGTPLPKVVWYKDGEPISKDDYNYQVLYLKDGTISLEIFYPKPEKDAAVYRCEAQNDNGVVFSEATVKVVARQREESLPREHYMSLSQWTRARSETRAGSETRSSVRASSESRFTTSSSVRSTRRIEDYYTGGRTRNYSSEGIDSSYEIYKPGYNSLKFLKTDSWEPELKLKVKWGSDNEFYFQENLKSKCILEGSRAMLSCFVIGRLPLFVQWYKDGKPLMNNIYERYGIRSRAGYLSLEIPVTEIEDTGDYLVDVRNEQGRMNSSCYLQIEPRFRRSIDFEKPSFVEGIHHIHVNEGQTATFQVQVKGNPQPGIKWFKDGKRVQMTDKTTIHTGKKGTSILMIHTCTFTDMGLYRVEAHNMYGRCSGSAKLNVFESGTKFVHDDKGGVQIIKRRYSFEDEETGENINLTNISSGSQMSMVNKVKDHEETTGRGQQNMNGLDEVDEMRKRETMMVNASSQNTEVISSSSAKLSQSSSNNLQNKMETDSKLEGQTNSQNEQTSQKVSNLQSSVKESRSEMMSEITSSVTSSSSMSQESMQAVETQAIYKESQTKLVAFESENMTSKVSTSENTNSVLEKSVSDKSFKVQSLEAKEEESTDKMVNEVNEKLSIETIEDKMTSSSTANQEAVTSELRRNESFEAIEKARKLSKGEVRLEKLHSPNGEALPRRLSKGTSVEEVPVDKPRRKLSKGFSFEENGQNGRRSSNGFSFEGNGQNGRRSSVEKFAANRVKGMLSRESSVEERMGKLSRKSSVDSRINGIDKKSALGDEKANDTNGRLKSGEANEVTTKSSNNKSSEEKAAVTQEVESFASKIVNSALESAIGMNVESNDKNSEVASELERKSKSTDLSSSKSLESSMEAKTSHESSQKASTVEAHIKVTEVAEDKSKGSHSKSESQNAEKPLEVMTNDKTAISPSDIDSPSSDASKSVITDEVKTSVNSDDNKKSSDAKSNIDVQNSMDTTETSNTESAHQKTESQASELKGHMDSSSLEEVTMQTKSSLESAESKSIAETSSQEKAKLVKSEESQSNVSTDYLESSSELSSKSQNKSVEVEISVESSTQVTTGQKEALESMSQESASLKQTKQAKAELESETISTIQKEATEASFVQSKESFTEKVSSAQMQHTESRSQMSMESAEIASVVKTKAEASSTELSEATSKVASTELSESTSKAASTELSQATSKVASTELSQATSKVARTELSEATSKAASTELSEATSKVASTELSQATSKIASAELSEATSKVASAELSEENSTLVANMSSRQSVEIDEKSLMKAWKTVDESASAEVEAGVDMGKEEDKETIYTTQANIVKYLPKTVEIKDGEPLKLQCLVSGTPNPKVVWFHNDQKITSDFTHISLTSKAQYHNLDISVTNFRRDSGTYTLKASNISGEDICHCQVNIEGKLEPETNTADSGTTEVSSELIDRKVDLSLECTDSVKQTKQKEEIQAVESISKKTEQKEEILVVDSVSKKTEQKEEILAIDSVSGLKLESVSAVSEDSFVSASSSVLLTDQKGSKLQEDKVEEDQSTDSTMVQRKKKSSQSSDERSSSSTLVVDNQDTTVESKTCIESTQESQQPELNGDAHFLVALKPEYCPMERDENVRLYVKVAGEPLGPVKWFKDGEELESSRRVMVNWDMVTQESTVVFRRFKLKDAGEYECVLMTSSGTFSSKTILNLKRLETQRVQTKLAHETPDLFLPLILYPIKDTTVYKGQEACFECAVDKQPNLTVKWYKDGREIRQKKRKYIFKESKGVYSLVIEDVQESDCGSYTFEVADEEGVESVNASIIMKVEKNRNLEIGPPTITEHPESILGVVEGGTIVLKCCAQGNPPPSFRWQKDMMDIIQSPRIVASVTEAGQSTLTICDAEYSDRGLYVCVVKNRLGRVKVRCNLHVGDEFKKKEETKKTKISSSDDQVENVDETMSTNSTLEMLSENLDEVDVVKSKISSTMDETKSTNANKTEIKSEFEVNLSEEDKTKLAADVANKDRIVAEHYIYLLMIEADKAKKEAENKTRIAVELAKTAKQVDDAGRIEAEKALLLAEQEAELARKNAEEKAKLAAEVAKKDKIAAEKAMLLYLAETEGTSSVTIHQTLSAAKVNTEASMSTSLLSKQETVGSLLVGESQIKETKEKGLESGTNTQTQIVFKDELDGSMLSVEKKVILTEEQETGKIVSVNQGAEIAAEMGEKAKIAAEEAEKARIAAEEAEKARIAAEEAEKARIAAEEAEKAKIAAEEAEKARIAAEEAEKARIATEEAEKARIAADKEIKTEKTEEPENNQRKKKKHRMTFEEAEQLRLQAEANENSSVSAEEAGKAKLAIEEEEKVRMANEEKEKSRRAAEEREKARIAAEEKEKARIASEEAEKARKAAEEAEKARKAAEEAEKARIVAEEAEKAKIAADEAEKARKAVEDAEKARKAAEEAEKARITAEEAEKARIAAEEAEKARIAAKEAEKARKAVEEAEKARIAAEEAEKARIAAEEAEKARIAAEEAEKARIAAEEAAKARIAAEEAEKARIAAEEAEKARIAAEEAENSRIAAEEAEKARIAAEEAEKARIAAEEAEKARKAAEEAEKARIAAEEAEKAKIAAEEAEKARIAAEEAEKAKIAAEEAEKTRIAAEEAEKARIAAAEEAEKARKAAEEAEKAKTAAEEAEKTLIAAKEKEKARLVAEEAEKSRIGAQEAEKAEKDAMEAEKTRKDSDEAKNAELIAEASNNKNKISATEEYEAKYKKKKHRMTFEEAEELRIQEEKNSNEDKNSIPSSISIDRASKQEDKVDGAVESKVYSQKSESSRSVAMMASGTATSSEQMRCSVSDSHQDFASNIRHQLQKQLSASGSKCEILEVSAQHITSLSGETTEEHRKAHHHIHHPPEIIIVPDSKRVPAHSELEIIVRAKASKHAKVRWVHDGQTVSFRGQQHYELITEEKPLSE